LSSPKRHSRRLGDVIQIDLGDGLCAYARVLGEATVAIYDCHCEVERPIGEILKQRVLFQVAVMNWAVKKGRWRVIGRAPLEDDLAVLRPKFIQDPLNNTQFSIYEHGAIRPASRDECIGLERAAVWDPEHVEDRIRDHFAGHPNKWVELLNLRS
jgi:hypothetical protein